MTLRPSTLAGRLLLAACLFLTAALIAASIIIAVILDQVVTDQVDQRLQAQTHSLASALTLDKDGRLAINDGLDGPPFDRLGSGWYWQVETGGTFLRSLSLGDSRLNVPPQPFEWRRVFSGRSPVVAGKDAHGRSLHVLTTVDTVANTLVTIRVSAPRSAIVEPLQRALLWLVPSIGILGLALIAATLLQIRLGLRPLHALGTSLQAVRTGQQSRVPADQPRELVPVVGELNALIQQNEDRLAAARLHLANMAHSLKTPLANLSLAVREHDRDPTGELAALTGQIETRVRHHLARARANAGGVQTRAQSVVASHMADLTAVLRKIYADRGIEPLVTVEPSLTVACEAQDFDEMMGNLLDNAFKWAARTVVVSARKQDGIVQIFIEDDGPGIPQALLGNAMLPGQRLDETVPGHGFGLSISRELVSLYGGSLVLRSGRAGGLRVDVELPA